ncbi:MAG: acetyl-CoA hydrolase/transferase family protein [Nocardioidaceae bacterium]
MESLRRVLSGLPPQPRIVTSGSFTTPLHLLGEVDRLLPTYRLWAVNAQLSVPDREGVELETPFVGTGMRLSPRLHYIPSRLSLVPILFQRASPPDAVLVHTSHPRNGSVSLGTDVTVLPAAIEAVRRRGGVVLAQANRYMPYSYGDAELSLDDIDLVVDADDPLPSPPAPGVDDASAEIGERVASLVGDGATLQAGIGTVPDAALARLRDRRDLRVWTEMFSDSILELERAGSLDRNRPITASFLLGSQELYSWLDGNPRVRMTRIEVTNDPGAIARNHAMTSINTALQVDLLGQANASRIHTKIYSGFGGQTDFIVGALHSWNGQALIALRSWHPRAQCSTIVPLLDEPVTSFQMSAVVTEQGVAEVFGHDQQAQVRNLIEHAAHPTIREELWEEAHALGLL